MNILDYERKAYELYISIRDDEKVRNLDINLKLPFADRLQRLCFEAGKQDMLDSITKEFVLDMLPLRGAMSFRRLDKAIVEMRDANFQTTYETEDLKVKIVELLKKGKTDTDIMDMLKDIRGETHE